MSTDQSGKPLPIGSKPCGRRDTVPAPAVRRLSLYLRELEAFLRQDRHTTSSKELGESLGYTDAQVRKDLAYFGHFGHPGVGYRIEELIARIRSILGTDRVWDVVVIGAGHLGQALSTYAGFEKKGFRVVAVFDNDPNKIGRRLGGSPPLEILPMERMAEFVAGRAVRMGVITVPADVAQQVADDLVRAGIKGILNFAPASLVVPPNVPVQSVALSVHLEQLAFQINARAVTSETRS